MEPNISSVASLIGDPARARMLTALMCGKALTATELSLEANITSQTASSHLAKLVQGQLLTVRKQGRHKYFQLKGVEVAELLEKLLNITSDIEHSKVITGPSDLRLRKARVCYDHLAGEMSVAVYDSLKRNEYIVDHNNETSLTKSGRSFFQILGIDFSRLEDTKRPLCRSCLDWSERRNHLAGSIGQWIFSDILDRGWAVRVLDSRAISFSQKGLRLFIKQYDIQKALSP